ncbi:MAG: hypothetical protein MRERV_11c075 [Mycoplasmataceae bacterium RV_VA103A]|nr:MAG: hypothetical protein MRERV_11c075 [Mycoplasmataceae bacterium RV_VA103A]
MVLFFSFLILSVELTLFSRERTLLADASVPPNFDPHTLLEWVWPTRARIGGKNTSHLLFNFTFIY